MSVAFAGIGESAAVGEKLGERSSLDVWVTRLTYLPFIEATEMLPRVTSAMSLPVGDSAKSSIRLVRLARSPSKAT